MAIHRLSERGLNLILKGKVKEPSTCVIKFYSNGCHMCHNLQPYYQDIAEREEYEDLHFFAFNVDNGDPELEKRLKFEGVPTIGLVKVYPQMKRKAKVRILKDPENPNSETWFTTRDIRDFIDREK